MTMTDLPDCPLCSYPIFRGDTRYSTGPNTTPAHTSCYVESLHRAIKRLLLRRPRQHRDNWSHETVRSLRRKIRNLKAEIAIRDKSIKRWRKATDYWYNMHRNADTKNSNEWRKSNLEQYRMTQRMAELIAENERYRRALATAESALNNCPFVDRLERQTSHEAAIGVIRALLTAGDESSAR